MSCCPCMMMAPLVALVPLVEKACASPYGRAATVALAPFLLLAAAVAGGYVEAAKVQEMAGCVASCECARSWAIGGAFLYFMAIKQCLKTGTVPKEGEKEKLPPVAGKIDGKPAAKAA